MAAYNLLEFRTKELHICCSIKKNIVFVTQTLYYIKKTIEHKLKEANVLLLITYEATLSNNSSKKEFKWKNEP